MELLIPLKNGSKTPLYEQIYEYIRNEIRNGGLRAAARLPSTRQLAENLKVSRSTTQLAYDQLVAEGYIEAKQYRGYFVCDTYGILEINRTVEKKEDSGGDERFKPSSEHIVVDFSPRGIDLETFPYGVWRKISRETLVDDNREMLLAGDRRGERNLREAIRDYLHSARGVECRPEQIIIGAGNEYLLMLLAAVLGRKRVIAMETPTYRQAYLTLAGQGMEIRPVEMDGSGMKIPELENSGADIAYVMPSHQFPTGIVMPVKRRQELLAWAGKKEGRYLIEDDYDSEFRYKGKPIPALQGMGKPEKVIYLGTFSQSIASAIRVSYMVLPPAVYQSYCEKAGFYASTVSRIDQNILYRFLEKGYYERHLNRMRAVYRAKHDKLLGELKSLENQFTVSGEYAGIHVMFTHRERTEQELIALAAGQGVKVYGLSSYFIGEEQRRKESSSVILGYASLTEEEIEEGAARLKQAWL